MRSICNRGTRQRPSHATPSGLTQIEAVITIIFLLFIVSVFWGIRRVLAPDPKIRARMWCSMNLSGIGKAMLIYADDFDGKFPRAGGQDPSWGPVAWNGSTRQAAYGTDANGMGGKASVSSSLYLLVKYAEVTPKSFICRTDTGTRGWSGEGSPGAVPEFPAYWDFGPNPQTHCSYTYHWPFGDKPLTTASEPTFAVAADRNPWIETPAFKAKPFPTSPDGKCRFQGRDGAAADQMYGNSSVHEEDGENVLFLDGHVTFEKKAYCSLEEDNIYTRSTFPDKGDPLGVPPAFSTAGPPPNRKDSVLVHDPPIWPGSFGQK